MEKLPLNTILQGDALEVLKTIPSESVDCVITSPPYWALRDYGTAKWEGGYIGCDHQIGRNTRGGLSDFQKGNKGGFGDEAIKNGQSCPKCGAKRVDQQLGLEPTFQEYTTKLCDIFDEVKRVLKKEGTCWINMGDTYYGSGAGQKDTGKHGIPTKFMATMKWKGTLGDELQSKTLCQIPSRFSIEMCNRGWILRNEIIWHKPNCMPSSVKDRFTVDFEKLFFFVKSKKYYFETQLEPYTEPMNRWGGDKLEAKGDSTWDNGTGQDTYRDRNMRPNADGRNMRSVWKIPTKPFAEAHFATFPEALIETPIKAGCPENGIVLDIFMGAGTTGLVAKKLGRNYLGIELNSAYISIAEKRLSQKSLFI